MKQSTILALSRTSQVAPYAGTRLLYPRKDAAYQLGISVRALDYLIADRKIPSQRLGGRILIPVAALVEFASKNYTAPIVENSKSVRTSKAVR